MPADCRLCYFRLVLDMSRKSTSSLALNSWPFKPPSPKKKSGQKPVKRRTGRHKDCWMHARVLKPKRTLHMKFIPL
ncbi:hypothetical protein, partial [Achromobacter phage kwar_LB4]